jgi:hypothetical protein
MLTTGIKDHLKSTLQTANQSRCMHLNPILLGEHFLKWKPHALGKWMELTKTPCYTTAYAILANSVSETYHIWQHVLPNLQFKLSTKLIIHNQAFQSTHANLN